MKNFNLSSLLIGLALGVLVGAGTMSLAGGGADNSDLQGRFNTLPDGVEVKEIDPDIDIIGGWEWEGGECDVTNCDLLVEIEDIQDSIGSWTLHDLADRQYDMAAMTADWVSGGSSWTLDNLADLVYDTCN